VEGYLLQMNEQQLADHIKATVPDTTTVNIKKAKELLAVAIPSAVLPKPGTGRVEEDMVIPFEPMPAGLKGRLDFVDLERDVPLVLDHKTTSDPAFAKTEDTLRADPQVILYAYWALLQRPNAQMVDVRYVYYLTRGGSRVWAVDIRLSRQDVEQSFAWLSQEISKMVSTFGVDDAKEIDFKLAACNSYGRPCPALSVCPAHAKAESAPKTGADRLRALAQANAVATTNSTKSAAYAAVPQESNNMGINVSQLKIAFVRFGKIVEKIGVSRDMCISLQEELLADPSVVSDLPEVSTDLKALDPATPTGIIGQITQWLVNESRRRLDAAKKAQEALSTVTATPVVVFEDFILSDEQAEIKDMLTELGYPETEAIRLVSREYDRAVDLVGNEIRYTGDDDDDDVETVQEAPVFEKPVKNSPLAGKATAAPVAAPVVVETSEAAAAFSEAVNGAGSGAAAVAMQQAYAGLSGDDLVTVDAWLVGRQAQVGKQNLSAFLKVFCESIDSSTLKRVNSGEEPLREIYANSLRVLKDGARVRNIGEQMPAIVRLFGGTQSAGGTFTLPFRDAEQPKPAPKPEPKPAPESTRLTVYVDIALVRGALPGSVVLSDLWMDEVVQAASVGEDPRLDKYGAALKPVAIKTTKALAARLATSDVDLFVDSTSKSWTSCSDEILAMADIVVRGV